MSENIQMDPNQEEIEANVDTSKEFFAVGIIGTGVITDTLKYAFTKPRNEIMVVDDLNNTVEDLIEWNPNIIFVNTAVNIDDDGLVEATDLESNVQRVLAATHAGVVIKTTLSPDLVDRICSKNARVVYNPDIPTETDHVEEKLQVPFHIMGGAPNSTLAVQEIYYRFSTFNISQSAHVSPVEAAFIEGSISSFIALKHVFYNQLYDAMEDFGGDFHTVSTYVSGDPRVGGGCNRVPTPKGNRGCDRKGANDSMKMLARFNERFTLIKEVDKMNAMYLNRKDD